MDHHRSVIPNGG